MKRDPDKIRAWQRRSQAAARRREREQPRRRISPASEEQRALAAAADRCFGCGRSRELLDKLGFVLDPAHLAPRSLGGCDDQLCTPFALCRSLFNGAGCHRDFDEGRLDLLARVAGEWDRFRPAVQHALEHLRLVQLVERLAAQRIRWEDA